MLAPLLPPLRLSPLAPHPSLQSRPPSPDEALLAQSSLERLQSAFHALSFQAGALDGLLQPFPPLS